MRGPYVSENGDVWIIRGDVPWPRAQREARMYLSEMGYEPWEAPMRFVGIESDVRISDEHEYTHGDDDECADSQEVEWGSPGFKPCCETVEAYHFRAVER